MKSQKLLSVLSQISAAVLPCLCVLEGVATSKLLCGTCAVNNAVVLQEDFASSSFLPFPLVSALPRNIQMRFGRPLNARPTYEVRLDDVFN